MSVLRQPAVTYLGKTELPLDNAELVFHLRPHPGFVAIPRTLRLRQLAERDPFAWVKSFASGATSKITAF